MVVSDSGLVAFKVKVVTLVVENFLFSISEVGFAKSECPMVCVSVWNADVAVGKVVSSSSFVVSGIKVVVNWFFENAVLFVAKVCCSEKVEAPIVCSVEKGKVSSGVVLSSSSTVVSAFRVVGGLVKYSVKGGAPMITSVTRAEVSGNVFVSSASLVSAIRVVG